VKKLLERTSVAQAFLDQERNEFAAALPVLRKHGITVGDAMALETQAHSSKRLQEDATGGH
jgi:hypothetical protein